MEQDKRTSTAIEKMGVYEEIIKNTGRTIETINQEIDNLKNKLNIILQTTPPTEIENDDPKEEQDHVSSPLEDKLGDLGYLATNVLANIQSLHELIVI